MRVQISDWWLAMASIKRSMWDGRQEGCDFRACGRGARHWFVAFLLASAWLLTACSDSSVDSRLADGKRLLANEDRKGAEIQLKSVLQEQPKNSEARFLLGKLRLDEWDFAAAESELRRAWDAGYDANKVGPLLARALLELGQPEQVLTDINPATLNDPAARALLDTYRALAQLARGYVDEAKATTDAVLRENPDLAAALVAQALIQMHGRDMDTAGEIVDGVLAKYPKDIDALILRARIAGLQGQYAVARARLQEAVAVAPAAARPRVALIALLFAAERYDEVREQVAILRQIPGGSLEARLFEAQLALQEKKYEAARDAVAQVLTLVPNHVPALLVAGRVELAIGSPAVAETYLAKVVDSSPQDPLPRRLLADARLRLGKPEAALATLETALQSPSADPLTLALAGQIEMQRGEYRRARQLFQRAVDGAPQDARMRAALAQAQIRSGDVAAGIGSLQELGTANTSQYLSDVMLVLTYLEEGDPDKALKAVSALEAKQPRNPLAANLRGVVLLRKGDTRAARQAFEAAVAVDPQFGPAVMNLVNLDVAAGAMDAARERVNGLLARQPGNADALLALAELKARTGSSYAEVIPLVAKAVAANPDAVLAHLALVRWYLAAGDAAKALEAALAAKEKFPRNADVLSQLGAAQLAAGDAQQAVLTLREVVIMWERVAVAHFQLARAQFAAGDLAGARRSLRRGLQLEPSNVDGRLAQIQVEARAGNHAEALDLARAFQKAHAKLAAGYLAEGDILSADKRYTEASAAYRKALAVAGSGVAAIKVHQSTAAGGSLAAAAQFAKTWLTEHPKDGGFREYLAERMIEIKDFEGAKRELATVIALQPDNALALNNLAWICQQTKDPRALEYAEKAARLAPNDPRILDTLGTIRLDRGELPQALDLLAKAAQLAPKSPSIGFRYATALVKSGRKGDALRELEHVLGLGQAFAEEQEARRLLRSL